jgi:hypothetical protein
MRALLTKTISRIPPGWAWAVVLPTVAALIAAASLAQTHLHPGLAILVALVALVAGAMILRTLPLLPAIRADEQEEREQTREQAARTEWTERTWTVREAQWPVDDAVGAVVAVAVIFGGLLAVTDVYLTRSECKRQIGPYFETYSPRFDAAVSDCAEAQPWGAGLKSAMRKLK